MGKFQTTVIFKGINYVLKIYVVSGCETSSLLARDDACKLNLVQCIDEVNYLRAYGLLKCEPVEIALYKLNVPRRVPFPLVKKVNKELHGN